MTAVDSSVWIANLHGLETGPVRRLRALAEDGDAILTGGLILLEVLQGAQDDAHAARIERSLRRHPVAPMLDAGLAVRAAANHRALRARGIMVRRTVDMSIGTFCMARGHALLHDDRNFGQMAQHLDLQVA